MHTTHNVPLLITVQQPKIIIFYVSVVISSKYIFFISDSLILMGLVDIQIYYVAIVWTHGCVEHLFSVGRAEN